MNLLLSSQTLTMVNQFNDLPSYHHQQRYVYTATARNGWVAEKAESQMSLWLKARMGEMRKEFIRGRQRGGGSRDRSMLARLRGLGLVQREGGGGCQ